jgi:alkane 1-monooxygenase
VTLNSAFAGTVIRHPATRYAAASLSPALMLALGALIGGVWALLGFLWITAFLFAADRLGRTWGLRQAETPPDAWTARLAPVIGWLHFGLLALALAALSGNTGLGLFGWLFTFLGFGLWFGQVANATAHELIHRPGRIAYWLGAAIYISLLYGHHTSAHRLVHHRFVATPDDPNSAAFGESFWEFLLRAWPGEFMAGYEMEKGLRPEGTGGLNPYYIYVGGACLMLMLVAEVFGLWGFLSYLLLCAHAQLQLLLADYVQHYGLERKKAGADRYEPFGPEHAWDAPDFVSGLMMLNAPRHADHHTHPARSYSELELSPGGKAPLLPASLPAMATLALIPGLWHRVMDMRVSSLRRARGL